MISMYSTVARKIIAMSDGKIVGKALEFTKSKITKRTLINGGEIKWKNNEHDGISNGDDN